MTPQDDQRAPVKGLAVGLALSILIWVVLFLAVGLTHG
jgi:hypothetical protein